MRPRRDPERPPTDPPMPPHPPVRRAPGVGRARSLDTGRRRRALLAAVATVALLTGAATGCAGRNGRNDTDPVPGEPSPARGNVPPDDPATRPAR